MVDGRSQTRISDGRTAHGDGRGPAREAVAVESATRSLAVRKFVVHREEVFSDGAHVADGAPLIKIAVAAVIDNPMPGGFQQDITTNVPLSVPLGHELVRRMLELIGDAGVASYGKGAIVGENGDQEQGVSFLTTAFGQTLREAVDGSEWISSVTKHGGQGTAIDIPLASKDYLWARSHYDAITMCVPDAPRANEIVVVIGAASRGRLNERCGGQTLDDKPPA